MVSVNHVNIYRARHIHLHTNCWFFYVFLGCKSQTEVVSRISMTIKQIYCSLWWFGDGEYDGLGRAQVYLEMHAEARYFNLDVSSRIFKSNSRLTFSLFFFFLPFSLSNLLQVIEGCWVRIVQKIFPSTL